MGYSWRFNGILNNKMEISYDFSWNLMGYITYVGVHLEFFQHMVPWRLSPQVGTRFSTKVYQEATDILDCKHDTGGSIRLGGT
jgi:hypothetical protein